MKQITFALALIACATVASSQEITFSPSTVNVGTRVQFTCEVATAQPRSYQWDFGEGTPQSSTQKTIEFRFHEPGLHRVVCTLDSGARVSAEVNVQDTRTVEAVAGPFSVGVTVSFRARNFADSSLRWDFGDRTVENGGQNERHQYTGAGNYTIKVYDFGGSTRTAITCTVSIAGDVHPVAPDLRRIEVTPSTSVAVGTTVTLKLTNSSAATADWKIGTLDTLNRASLTVTYQFKDPGRVEIQCLVSGQQPVRTTVTVSDPRQIQMVPNEIVEGSEVYFNALNFAAPYMKYDFGDGQTERSGPRATHVYRTAGTYQLKIFDFDGQAKIPVEKKIFVLKESRQITLKSRFAIAGADVELQALNFKGQVQWDFGDGTVLTGGTLIRHPFRLPGTYTVRASDPQSQDSKVIEKAITVEADVRQVSLLAEMSIAGADVELQALNFKGQVQWDFGDGTVLTGGTQIRHPFRLPGTYKVRASDLQLRDGKVFEKTVVVTADIREVTVPSEIIAGEAFDIALKNAAAGPWNWKMSDGDTQSGVLIKKKIFSAPGTYTLVVADGSGAYPPLEKKVQVVADRRSLNVSAAAGLPNESLMFTASGFKGPKVKWDFGDGTVLTGGALSESHAYAKAGQYRVSAVDFGGSSVKTFTADVAVTDQLPDFEVTALEFVFDNGKYYRVLPKSGASPTYHLRLKSKGRGILRGTLLLDGMVSGLFQILLRPNQLASLDNAQMTALPLLQLGLHELTFQFSNYTFPGRIPILKYFVTLVGGIDLVYPPLEGKIEPQAEVKLRWEYGKKGPHFQVAVSQVPFQFQTTKDIKWSDAEEGNEHAIDLSGFVKGEWIYWQVRAVDTAGTAITTSEIGAFKVAGSR